ncbi:MULTISPECIES: DUF2059 domain-containing protein [unclassified Sphingomonas]|uniref:DUF2059 domain-containing protein n=1 Tax=unclassified Sphingomonas TaxID=196159 RepID=UPI0013005DA0|nr:MULTISPECIES: DUF2059 domain-containing protein [unclassified Sphingomonas]
MMRRAAALALAAASVTATAPVQAAPAQAAAPGTIATARAIVAAMHVDRSLDTMFAQLTPLVSANILNAMQQAKDAPPALKARIATPAGREQVSGIVGQEIIAGFRGRYDDIAAGLAEEYVRTFSEAELQTILAFYRSPTGAKLIDAQPAIQRVLSEQGRAIGREVGMAAFPKILQRVTALDAPQGK